jgi:hypothetical protein
MGVARAVMAPLQRLLEGLGVAPFAREEGATPGPSTKSWGGVSQVEAL